MRATHIVLAFVWTLVIHGPALAGCPVADAKIEKDIATKPEFRDGANAKCKGYEVAVLAQVLALGSDGYR